MMAKMTVFVFVFVHDQCNIRLENGAGRIQSLCGCRTGSRGVSVGNPLVESQGLSLVQLDKVVG